jgi:hypothetical protein
MLSRGSADIDDTELENQVCSDGQSLEFN